MVDGSYLDRLNLYTLPGSSPSDKGRAKIMGWRRHGWKVRERPYMFLERTCPNFLWPWVTSGLGIAYAFLFQYQWIKGSHNNGFTRSYYKLLHTTSLRGFSQLKEKDNGRTLLEECWREWLSPGSIAVTIPGIWGHFFSHDPCSSLYTEFQPQGLCPSSLALSYPSISSHYSLYKWGTQE